VQKLKQQRFGLIVFVHSTNPHTTIQMHTQHAKLLYSGQTGHEMTAFPAYEVCTCIRRMQMLRVTGEKTACKDTYTDTHKHTFQRNCPISHTFVASRSLLRSLFIRPG
jgi:hypothetical protein